MNKKKDRKIKDMRKLAALLVFFLLLLVICIANVRRVSEDTKQELASTNLYAAAFPEPEEPDGLVVIEDSIVPLAAGIPTLIGGNAAAFDAAKAVEELEQKALNVKSAITEIEIDKRLVEQRKDELLVFIRTNIFPFGTDAIESVRDAVMGDAKTKKVMNGSIVDDTTVSIVDSALTTVGSEQGTK